ncbi:hypothetical protein DOS84_01345 [Flavobacterium aquariorum]|uniref:Secretion system C-terminal sorting domain-containing protein n=1 Tax=Flavobacterium aquariorum TaxID=2217670 RepID=A0A2W7U132_9FLAO|nr:T9SS type A sorting domain-containing protein [Flavobacterium aquariorum]PZX95236.1 hypothetical protein DOS84_01345 [Flavobacterium aquariorum]
MKIKLLIVFTFFTFNLFSQINLVPNNGFEDSVDNKPFYNWATENTITPIIGDCVQGSTSAKLSIANNTFRPKITAQVFMDAGVTYTVKFKYKYLSANYSGDHPISLNISQNGSATTLSSSAFAIDNNWILKETTFTPDQYTYYDLSISLFTFDNAAFDVLIDDVQVYIQGTEQYTLIPDVNFEKKLIALGIDSGPTDGEVPTINIKNVGLLDVSSSSISDLTGIQDFEDLWELICNTNQLTNLDVSKNINLNSLYCYNNHLTSLDVSNNINLDDLNCSTNQLTYLDVSKNVKLLNLDCDKNQLISLDLSKNLKLATLYCSNNLLASLDVSQNIDLTGFSCSTNRLTSLDVSKNIKLSDLGCYTNQLTNLDVTKNIKLERLSCQFNKLTNLDFSQNIKLKLLECEANQLTSLDVSKNIALNILYCSKNKLLSLNLKNGNNVNFFDPTYLSNFTGNPNLNCIQVDDAIYSNANWSLIKDNTANFNTDCAASNLYTYIPDINFENKLISLGIDSGVADGKVLTNSVNKLTSLDVSSSSIADLTGIQDFVALKYLNCYSNQLKSLDISNNLNLTELRCSSNQLTSLNVSKNTALLILSCTYNQITSLDVSNNINLTELRCSNNQLTSLNVSKNVALQNLYCSSNQLTNLNVSKNVALVNFACPVNKITSLDLSNNPALDFIACYDNSLSTLNLKNGHNYSLTNPNSSCILNPSLSCIQVDNVDYATTGLYLMKDSTANFNTDCTPYTMIPDANFEDKLIALEIDKDGKNGKVATASINQVTFLDVADSNISDLTGLQDFTALIYFFCERNKITTVDFSKNLMLENIGVAENNLTSLDVSKNTKIHSLDFTRNQITSIDLSQNTNLKRLGFNYNKLTEINLTNNNLTELHCRTNNLTNINLTNQPNLVFLECGVNKTVSLDLSANKKLEELHCEFMELTSLNLSENKELILLNAFGNQLTSLDVSQNPKLKALYIEFNPLKILNLQNGNNENFVLAQPTNKKSQTVVYTSFLNNPNLSCIQVDNVTYSNAKWANIKDPTATYSSTCSKLGIEDSVFDKVSIYPNPTQGELHIDNIVLEKATVYDALGKLVKTTTFTSGANDNTMHLDGFASGIYYIYLESEGANTAKKIIVE